MTTPRFLAVAGSLRAGSLNRRLLRVDVAAVRTHGGEIDEVDLREHPLPLYDGDIESSQGIPETARTLRERLAACHGLIIAAPEYNGSLTGVLKNTIDWVSRPDGDVPGTAAFRGRCAALVSASPGGLGGVRGLLHLRVLLGGIGMLVIPEQVSVPAAHEAFDDDGALRDDALRTRVDALATSLPRAARCVQTADSPDSRGSENKR